MSKSYSAEIKAAVVKAVLDDYRPIAEVSREFGIPQGTFGAWVSMERGLRRDRAEKARQAVSAPVSGAEVQNLRDENLILHEGLSAIRSILLAVENAIDA